MALGLAVGAGYVLGRSKKARVALAVGGLVAGKRMNLSPKAVGELVARQLRDNPQFKEVGAQLRQDLGGVGRAASGAVVERRLNSLANRLHGRTSQVRDQLAGVTGTRRRGDDEDPDAYDEPGDEAGGAGARDEREETDATEETERRGKAPVRKQKAAGTAPEKKASAKSAPEKKAAGTAAKRTPAKTAAKRTTAAGKPAARKTAGARRTAEGARGRRSKGSGDQ
jgi:hypothetical protein